VIAPDAFLAARARVLQSHPSGAEVDFDGGVRTQRSLGPRQRFHRLTAGALRSGEMLLQPRAGVATIAGQSELLGRLAGEGGADVLPLTIDSFTRQLDFAHADALWREAEATATPGLLNGFPAISAGVAGCNAVVRACDRALQVRHGAPDARLLAEVTLAAGCSAFEGGGITYCIPYSKTTPLEQSLRWWAYVDRLCGLYAAHGVVVEREAFGALTGIMIPPSIAVACSVLELLLAAEQGVAAFALGIGQGGDLVQDAAAIRALDVVGRAYLRRHRPAHRVQVSTVFYQWMGPFPRDEAAAAAIIALGAAAAVAGGATRMITKSCEEAHGVPGADSNAAGLRLSRAMASALAAHAFADPSLIREEQHWIERESRCLLDNVLRLSESGSLADGICTAFDRGQLDVPFAPSLAVRGSVWTQRDARRAIRYREVGHLPFDRELRQRNDRELDRRRERDGDVGATLRALAGAVDDIFPIQPSRSAA